MNSKRQCALKTCKKRSAPADMIIREPLAWCDHECQTQHAMMNLKNLKQSAVKAAKEKKRENTRKKKAHYAKDRSHQFELTRKSAQKLANRLDALLHCICCDEPRGKAQFCGGHAKTGAGHPELALDLCNIHGQRNALCNQNKSGNWGGDKHSKGFKQGLLDRYGQHLIDYLEQHQPRAKLSCQELIELRAVYEAEIRRLERGEPASRNWRQPGDFDVLRASLPCNTKTLEPA